jgi:hypothetical protein
LDVSYGKGTEHIQGSPFRFKNTGESTSQIERWHGTVKARTKVMRDLKNLETAHDFVAGFLAFYNYLRPHESLENKTPAEVAGIAYPYKNWTELITSYKPSHKVTIEHVKRGTEVKIHGFKSKRPNRITPPMPKISEKVVKLK